MSDHIRLDSPEAQAKLRRLLRIAKSINRQLRAEVIRIQAETERMLHDPDYANPENFTDPEE